MKTSEIIKDELVKFLITDFKNKEEEFDWIRSSYFKVVKAVIKEQSDRTFRATMKGVYEFLDL